MKSLCLAVLLFPALALAQTAPTGSGPGGPTNLIVNGGFESFGQQDNLWDGVDADGYLCAEGGGASAAGESGAVESVSMPVSVQVADLNGDGLFDLFTVDPQGYFRIYFNSGTKTAPKFTNCELVPLYLSRFGWEWSYNSRAALKACLADLDKRGAMDLVLGDWVGELMIIRNTGSNMSPEFRQPEKIESIIVPSTKDGHLWANLLAPAVWDWDRDGKPDFIVGEGSYSANAIHLLLNKGPGSQPKLSEEDRYFLAYGDGREQLVPAIVDYNGDGLPDLIVGDRRGNLNLYLSEGQWAVPPATAKRELTLKSSISCGSVSNFGSPIAPTVADLNGDGLFDLVIGKTNGRIAVAYNKGTKAEPKFDAPVELKGVDVWGRNTQRSINLGWSVDFGHDRGNMYGYITTVNAEEDKDAAPVEGKYALKFGYLPVQNKIVKMPPFLFRGNNKTNGYVGLGAGWWGLQTPNWAQGDARSCAYYYDSNLVIMRQYFNGGILKPDTNYKLSFKAKGRSVKEAHWTFSFAGWGKHEASSVTHNTGRGVTIKNTGVVEEIREDGDYSVGASWTECSKQVRFTFSKNKDLNAPDKWKGASPPEYRGGIEIRATLAPGEGLLYLDDVKLVPVAGF